MGSYKLVATIQLRFSKVTRPARAFQQFYDGIAHVWMEYHPRSVHLNEPEDELAEETSRSPSPSPSPSAEPLIFKPVIFLEDARPESIFRIAFSRHITSTDIADECERLRSFRGGSPAAFADNSIYLYDRRRSYWISIQFPPKLFTIYNYTSDFIYIWLPFRTFAVHCVFHRQSQELTRDVNDDIRIVRKHKTIEIFNVWVSNTRIIIDTNVKRREKQ